MDMIFGTMTMNHVLIINGPNLNMLGTRQPDVYGSKTLADIEDSCNTRAESLGIRIDFRQSNSEGELVDWIQQSLGTFDAIVINAGAYTHTSVAILDALLAVGLPVVEVHMSNIYKRDEFRHHSFITRASEGMICGLGSIGYELALESLVHNHNPGTTKEV